MFNCRILGRLSFFEQVAAGLHGRQVILIDVSTYEPGRCCNGGHYRHYSIFHLTNSGAWEVCYDTSSEFGVCPLCGQSGDCHEYCRTQYLTKDELVVMLNNVVWSQQATYVDGPAYILDII